MSGISFEHVRSGHFNAKIIFKGLLPGQNNTIQRIYIKFRIEIA